MKLRRFINCLSSFVLIAYLLCSITLPAKASTKSNYYISGVYATIDTGSNGNLSINFTVIGIGQMDKIGVTTIRLYEDSGNGFEPIKTFSSDDREFSYMVDYNVALCNESVPYKGTVGNDYYAVIYAYAENQYGSDSDSVTTSVVTAS